MSIRTRISCSIGASVSTSCSAKYGNRSTTTRPAPRSRRGANVSQNNRTPVAAAIRPAATRPSPRSEAPRSNSAVRFPFRNASTAAPTAADDTGDGSATESGSAGGPASSHATSAGTINDRDLAGGRASGPNGPGTIGGDRAGARRRVDPARHGPSEADDVGSERCVVLGVVGGVVADDVDDRRGRPPGVVQIGEAVRKPWSEVEQGRRRPLGHAAVAVGHAGHRPLEQPEHRSHPLDAVDRGHEVHLRGPRVRETHLDAGVHQRAQQTLGTVHVSSSMRQSCRRTTRRRDRGLGRRPELIPDDENAAATRP